jgi:mannose-6-phosphate isomerase-like protein (cupin superfamily)
MNNKKAFSDLPLMQPVSGHHNAVPFFITMDMFSGVPFELAGGDISGLVDKPVASSHKHEVDEIYFLISPLPGEAIIDVTIDMETTTYSSPAVIHVPAGHEHNFITRKANKGSYCFGILYKKGDVTL